mmetsp:Transcript_23690/g.42310  ORF Transcript_23690/g.42310 Transcript_23690/m.42310 type:complete len:248 (-) Transcript_23690:506-1249(-)
MQRQGAIIPKPRRRFPHDIVVPGQIRGGFRPGHLKPLGITECQRDCVTNIGEGHNRIEKVIPIILLAGHMQTQVDLGRGENLDRNPILRHPPPSMARPLLLPAPDPGPPPACGASGPGPPLRPRRQGPQSSARASIETAPRAPGPQPNTHRPNGHSPPDRQASVPLHAPYGPRPRHNGQGGRGPNPASRRYTRCRDWRRRPLRSSPKPHPAWFVSPPANSQDSSAPAAGRGSAPAHDENPPRPWAIP